MARTESSFERLSVTAAISVHIARLIAFRTSGRLKVTVAIAPSCSTRIRSLMDLLLDTARSAVSEMSWWRREDSNLRHGAYETPALPPELRRRVGDRTENLQTYGAGVKRASVV